MYAAVRMFTLCCVDSSNTSAKLRHIMSRKALVDDVLRPEVSAAILYPLEVRDGHAARVREDVRDDEHALLVENRVGAGSRRPFAPSQMIFARIFAGVLARDHVLERGRNEHVDVEREQLIVADRRRP